MLNCIKALDYCSDVNDVDDFNFKRLTLTNITSLLQEVHPCSISSRARNTVNALPVLSPPAWSDSHTVNHHFVSSLWSTRQFKPTGLRVLGTGTWATCQLAATPHSHVVHHHSASDRHAHLMMTRFPFTSTLSRVSLLDRDMLLVSLGLSCTFLPGSPPLASAG